MNIISLRPITERNYHNAFSLQLKEGQEQYVSSPIRSLALAYIYRSQCQPFGIYCEEEMVGYVMVIYDYDIPEYDIWHMMIDKKHQRKGYGEKAIKACLEYIDTKPFGPSPRIVLTCHPDNLPAMKLYQKLGFTPTGARDDEEIEMVLYRNPSIKTEP